MTECKLCNKSNLILDVTFKVINLEDQGSDGVYWALDNIKFKMVGYTLKSGELVILISGIGHWQTFKGARSPSDSKIVELSDACGKLINNTTLIFPSNT